VKLSGKWLITHWIMLSLAMLSGCGGSKHPMKNQDVNVPAPAAAIPEPLPKGLAEFELINNRYADTARAASLAYAGDTDAAVINQTNAGIFLGTLLYGPLSTANTPGGLPLADGDNVLAGAPFPGYPIAILLRTGIIDSIEPKGSIPDAWWEVFADFSGGQRACSGGGTVTWSSNLLLDAASLEDERHLTWNACRDLSESGWYWGANEAQLPTEGILLNGSMRLHRSVNDLYTVAWDSVEYSSNLRAWRLTGVETSSGENGCGIERQRVSHLLIESLDEGEDVLLENFHSVIAGEPTGSSVCRASGLFNNSFSGRVLRSDLGAVEVTTPAHLSFLSVSETIDKKVETLAIDPNDPAGTSEGEMLLAGADGGELRFRPMSFSRFGEEHEEQYIAPSVSAFELDVTEANLAPYTLRLPRIDARHGLLVDTGDDDSDGMTNAWEIAYGLDPLNPMDSGTDKDEDGLDAYKEFIALTSPHVADPLSADSDEEISATFARLINERRYTQLLPPGSDLLVGIHVNISEAALKRKEWRVTLQLEGDVQFSTFNSYSPFDYGTTPCVFGDENKLLICRWEENKHCSSATNCDLLGVLPRVVPIQVLGDTAIKLTSTLEHGTADPDFSNDKSVATLEPPFVTPVWGGSGPQ